MFSDVVVPGNLPILAATALSLGAWIWAANWLKSPRGPAEPPRRLFEPILRPRRVWTRETVITALLGVFVIPLLAAIPLVQRTEDAEMQARLILSLSMMQLAVATAALVLFGIWRQTGMSAWSRDVEFLSDEALRKAARSLDDSSMEEAVEQLCAAAEQHRLAPPTISSDVHWGVWAGLAGLAPGYAINALVYIAGWKSDDATHPIFEAILNGGEARFWILLYVAFTAIVLAPLLEEIQYRAVIQGWLTGRFPTKRAILITAVVFAAIHWAPGRPDALPLLPLALLLGYLYAARGSLAANVIAHTTFNAVNIAIAVAELLISDPAA